MTRFGKLTGAKLLSRSALGVALALGTVAGGTVIAADPAMAQNRGNAPKINPSKGFVEVAAPAQKAIDDVSAGDTAGIEQARTLLEQSFAAIESEDDRFMAGSLAINLGSKAQDPALQRRGVKAMLESGKGSPDDLPRFNAVAGQLAYQAGDYAEAAQHLQIAIDGGFTENNAEALLAEAHISNNQPAQGLAILKRAIDNAKAGGQAAPESWYRRGLAAAYQTGAMSDTVDFATKLVRDYPTTENWGASATILRQLGNFNSQETLDLMRLMGRTNSYAEERDYVEYIQAADPRRLPGEVVEVIEAGVQAGKLNASDTFVSDARREASGRISADKQALAGYESDARAASASEATVTGAADALLSYGQAANAEELYTIALNKPGVDTARVQTRLGIAQIDLGKYAEAQETLARVTGNREPIAKLWSAYAASQASPPATAAAQ